MNEEDNIPAIKRLVAINQIKDAISFLSEHFGQSELGNQIQLVSSRFHQLESLNLNNLIKFEDYILESNKLRFSILELCDNIRVKNEPAGSEIDELLKLLQYRAQKINEVLDSIDYGIVNRSSTHQEFLRTFSGVNRHKDKILKSKNQFNEFHKKHIEALEAKNFILANDIARDIHSLLFKLGDLDIGDFGSYYHMRPTLIRRLINIYKKKEGEESFFEIWHYSDNSTISNFKKWQTIKEGIEDIVRQLPARSSLPH